MWRTGCSSSALSPQSSGKRSPRSKLGCVHDSARARTRTTGNAQSCRVSFTYLALDMAALSRAQVGAESLMRGKDIRQIERINGSARTPVGGHSVNRASGGQKSNRRKSFQTNFEEYIAKNFIL